MAFLSLWVQTFVAYERGSIGPLWKTDFAEVSSGIPTEFNVSRSKPDKTRTVNSAKFWRGQLLPTEQTIWVVLNSPPVASVYVTRELGNITLVSQGSKSFRVFLWSTADRAHFQIIYCFQPWLILICNSHFFVLPKGPATVWHFSCCPTKLY